MVEDPEDEEPKDEESEDEEPEMSMASVSVAETSKEPPGPEPTLSEVPVKKQANYRYSLRKNPKPRECLHYYWSLEASFPKREE